MDDEQEAELRNPFPSPPSHYIKYTAHNLKLLSLLQSHTADNGDALPQEEVLADQKDVPEWPLVLLEKPRVDWILEDGQYNVFGDTWFIKENIPSLRELGGQQLYPEDPNVDRRPVLLSILRSLLVTYSSLLSSLLSPPPPTEATPEWSRNIEWITVMAQNIMAAANDLRPVQARCNLELMMRRQLELRREDTKAIHNKCDSLESKLAELRTMAATISSVAQINSTDNLMQGVHTSKASSTVKIEGPAPPSLTEEDVLRWAEEVA